MLRACTLVLVVFVGLATALWADSEKNIALSLLGSYASGTPSTANMTANPL